MSDSAGVQIHPTSIVSSNAVIGAGTIVGPYCVVGAEVVLGARCRLHSHVVIDGRTTCGDENEFFPFSSIGLRPQDLKYRGEESTLRLGSRNVVREYVTLQPGTAGGGMTTEVGDSNLFMANSHLGHDGKVGNNNIVANSCALAGHVTLGSHVVLGGLSGVHQFVRIGDYAMLGAGSMVELDIPPYAIGRGDRAKLQGINSIGLKRHGFTAQEVSEVKRAFRELFFAQKGGSFESRLALMLSRSDSPKLVHHLTEFCRSSQRGITPGGRRARSSESDTEQSK